MNESKCELCANKNPQFQCGICHCHICKKCTQFLDEDAFKYIDVRPPEMTSQTYCETCFNDKVSPEILKYEEILEQANDIRIFDITQTKETRLLKRKEPKIKVEGCLDKEEAQLKLAYQAAKLGFNAVIDVEIKLKKIINGRYQTSEASGVGVPVQVTEKKLVKDRSFRSDPN